MLIYWEKNVGGVQKVNSDTKEDDEGCEIQKPHMKNAEIKEYIIDPLVNIVFIFNLQMNKIAKVRDLGCRDLKMICQAYRLNQQ